MRSISYTRAREQILCCGLEFTEVAGTSFDVRHRAGELAVHGVIGSRENLDRRNHIDGKVDSTRAGYGIGHVGASESGVHVGGYELWFMRFIGKLLENDRPTLKLLRVNQAELDLFGYARDA